MEDSVSLRGEIGPISPTALGSFVKLERCGQYLGWTYLADDLVGEDGRFDESLLSPLYAETGTQFEADQLKALLDQRRVDQLIGAADEVPEGITLDENWADLGGGDRWGTGLDAVVEKIQEVHDTPGDFTVVCTQPPLSGQVGAWDIAGKTDIIVIRPPRSGTDEQGEVVVDVLEVKASESEQTSHRIQAACYSKLLREAVDEQTAIAENTTFKGGVVTRSNAITGVGYQFLESFDLLPAETDVEMLLGANGRVDKTLFESGDDPSTGDREPTDAWEMTNRMSRRCSGCDFHDVCYSRAVEEDGLELLGFPEGTQDDLAEVGIETLGDLGDLVEYDRFLYPSKRTNEQVEIADQDLFETVRDEVGLKDLERYAIAADVFSKEGSADRPASRQMIPDSGYNLPSGKPKDSPLPDWTASYPNESLIRVYLYVQEDTIRERLTLLGGYVTNHRTSERRHVSAISDDLPGARSDDATQEEKDDAERTLIQDFLKGTEEQDGLIDAIQQVAPQDLAAELDDVDMSLPGFVHLYLYSPAQRQSLTQAAKRHTDNGSEFEALRTLLGLRTEIDEQDVDQEMVSVLQEEFVMRHLLRFLGFGTVQTVEQFERPLGGKPPDYRTWDTQDFDWQHPVDGESIDIPLQHVFGEHLFENAIRYDTDDRVKFDIESGLEGTKVGENYAGQFPFAHRNTDTIPLEYIWAAFDELTLDWIDPDAFDDPEKADRLQQLITRFRWVHDKGSKRIELRHLRALAEKFAESVEHIEASIVEWHKNDTVPKQPLPLDELLQLDFDESELELTAREYLSLEHGAKDRQLRREWRQSVPYRVKEGSSILFRCTTEPESDDETCSLSGEIWEPGSAEAEHTESSISAGDWVVMTPVDDEQDPPVEVGVNRASDIARMPLVHVTNIDEDGSITVAAPWNEWDHWPQQSHDYLHGHHRYVSRSEVDESTPRYQQLDGESNRVVIDEGASFILDTAHDDVVSYHCSRALDHSTNNHVLDWLNDLLTGDRDQMDASLCDKTLIEGHPGNSSFVETKFTEADSIEYEPNEPQRRFIRETDRKLVVVQGPPGTGKTSYTTSPAVLGRAYAFEQEDRPFAGAISALSHDAVDELFSEIRAVAEDCRDDTCFNQMKLVRVRPSDLPEDCVPYEDRDDDQLVEHIAYHHDEGEERLKELYEDYAQENEENTKQLLLFGPPTSIRGAVDKIAPLIVDSETLDRDGDWDTSVWELLEEGEGGIFDLAVVDEASMMDLPLLFLVGSFLDEDGQLLLAGDHRQMQPIRTHQWEEETRETIEETVPFLSALDYIRFLRGDTEEMEFIERDSPELDNHLNTDEQEQAVLPIYPLEQSYRLPQPVADLLTDLFYYKDGIELGGVDDREPIPTVASGSDAIDALVDPESWVTVLVHDGEHDERTSEIERAVVQSVTAEFDIVEPDDEDIANGQVSAGVVIPFTAQRDQLQGALDDSVQAQTVEKFQGGERDIILMSMVASEPGYVNQLSEFLLSPHRFNVAASRMKRKLIIVASESVFQTSHPDSDQYEDQMAWKRLYSRIGALDDDTEPVAEGTVDQFDDSIEEEAGFEVYHASLQKE